jgi:predicted dienelactone hydrolase
MKYVLTFLTALLLARLAALNTDGYTPPAPTSEVAIAKLDWHDAERDRDVPVKVYFQKDGTGPFSAVIFSHGLGGSRDGYAYLGRHWAGAICRDAAEVCQFFGHSLR